MNNKKFRCFLTGQSLEDRCMLASFKMVLLPDTQGYTESFPAIFDAQTQWVADHVQSDNLVFLSHVGDVVENPQQEIEWQRAVASLDILDGDPQTHPDGAAPYSVLPGNHDYDVIDHHSTTAEFFARFSEDRYSGKSWYGGSSPDGLNHFQFFSGDGRQFLHLAVEWEPRDSSAAWAQSVLEAYSDVPTVLSTHAYLDNAGGRSTSTRTDDGRSGEEIFQDLVAPYPQVFMVMGGHSPGEEHQTSLNHAGQEVFELLADYQNRPNGGDGWLQLVEFVPEQDRIDVTTYSPTLDQFETDADSQFSFAVDFDQRFGFAEAPRARLIQPLDNSPQDLNPIPSEATGNTFLASLEIQLLDFSPGVNDATVSSAAITLTQDAVSLTESVDYLFAYNATTDVISLTPISGQFTDGVYQVTLGGGSPIADLDGNNLPNTTLTVVIDSSLPSPPNSLYFSVNNPTLVDGVLAVGDEDLVFYDGQNVQMFFDGSDVGVSSLKLSGAALISDAEFLLSFTGSGSVPGIGSTVDDSDIVKFTAAQTGDNTAGVFELYFDGSDVGLTTGDEDIDALSVLDDGRIVISTRGVYAVPGAAGDDEDLLAFTPTSLGDNTAGMWELYFDGDDVSLASEDINAVSVYPNGDIYMSNSSSFSLPGIEGKDDDVLRFTPQSLGGTTSGVYQSPLYFDGGLFGLSSLDLYSIHVPAVRSPNANTAPTISSIDDQSIVENTFTGPLPFTINDSQTPADQLIVTAVSSNQTLIPDANLSLGGAGVNRTITATPAPGQWGGPVVITVMVSDGLLTAQETFNVTVTPEGGPLPTLYFALDANATLPGGLSPANEDIIAFDGFSFSIYFDGSDVGLSGEKLNALAILDTGEILMSLASSDTIPGIAGEVVRHDVVIFTPTQLGETTAGSFAMYVDGSDVGLTENSHAIDAVDLLSDGRVLISTSGTTTVQGVTARDEDMLALSPTSLGENTSGVWSLYFDGSDVDLGGEDIDAAAVDDDGAVYLSVQNLFSVTGASGDDEDVFVFNPTSLGGATAGSYDSALFFDGSQHTLTARDIRALDIVASQTAQSTQSAAALPPSPTSSLAVAPLATSAPARNMTESVAHAEAPTLVRHETPTPNENRSNSETRKTTTAAMSSPSPLEAEGPKSGFRRFTSLFSVPSLPILLTLFRLRD